MALVERMYMPDINVMYAVIVVLSLSVGLVCAVLSGNLDQVLKDINIKDK